MQVCSSCNVNKEDKEFRIKNKKISNKLSGRCNSCLYLFQKTRWIHRKKKAVELFGGKCSICGYAKNLSALHFHHLDPSKKEFSWSKAKMHSWDKTIVELKKCILVCSNCHAELHWPQCVMGDSGSANAILNKDVTSVLPSTGTCPICQTDVYGTIYCSVLCASLSNRKVERPSKEQLALDVEAMPMIHVGKKYGVSDNAIRKWVKFYGIVLASKQKP